MRGPVAALAGLLLAGAAAVAGAADLDRDQRAALGRGEPVVVTRPVASYPWPEVTVSRIVAAPAAEVLAVYAAVERHVEWMPGVVRSAVLARPDRATVRVAYEYEAPGPNERYTVDIRLARDGEGWMAAWELVEARYARRLSGRLHAGPHPAGALVTYQNRVDPGPLGVALGSPATTVRRMEETMQALASRVDRLRQRQPSDVARLVEALHAAVGAGAPGERS